MVGVGAPPHEQQPQVVTVSCFTVTTWVKYNLKDKNYKKNTKKDGQDFYVLFQKNPKGV